VREALSGARAVIHAATLHKPHIVTHTAQQFVDTNVSGTLALLEESVAAGVEAFVFTSTTSAFGAALASAPGQPGELDHRGRGPGARRTSTAPRRSRRKACAS
jgi:UDP-glucose 4-epimerase